jgi:hypothetical protein
MKIEIALWFNWKNKYTDTANYERVYFGHETCPKILPNINQVKQIIETLTGNKKKISFVTPYLTDNYLKQTIKIAEYLNSISHAIEIICSDWGLLYFLAKNNLCTPVIGRLLAGQSVDPRLMRLTEPGNLKERVVYHLDGTKCKLLYKRPSKTLSAHYQSLSLDKKFTLDYFQNLGINRCEINNLGQGLNIAHQDNFRYSLHFPYVLITTMRECPDNNENYSKKGSCNGLDCMNKLVTYKNAGLKKFVFRNCNALFYSNLKIPDNLNGLPVDRIVTSDIKFVSG